MDTYLTTEEAAQVLRISPRTLERYRLAGIGQKFLACAGRRRLYRRIDLDSWLAATAVQSTAEAKALAANAA